MDEAVPRPRSGGGGPEGGGPEQAPEPVRAHPRFASWYPKVAAANDRAGFAAYRVRLLDGLRGEVVEIGPGSGLNFPYYPAEVTRIVAVEPEPRMRELAGQAARELSDARIEVAAGVAEDLPLPDGAVDAVVVSLVLCSVPDQAAVLAEVRRVLRPGGQFRFLEHVRARGGIGSVAQRALDATVWPMIGGGCHCARRTEQVVAAAGFEFAELERFRFPASRLAVRPTAPHVIGSAMNPLP